jgi:hypothetical protein
MTIGRHQPEISGGSIAGGLGIIADAANTRLSTGKCMPSMRFLLFGTTLNLTAR